MQADYPGAEAHFLPPDRFGYPNNNAHVAIVLHKTGGDPTPESVEQTFLNSGRSVHYVVGQDGRVLQFILESSGAGGNCCTETGYDAFWDQYLNTYNADLNLCTLSIEHCDPALDNSTPLTPAQKDASFKLVAYLAQKYHIDPDHIKGHDSIDPVDRARCPGNYPWEELYAYLKGATIDFSVPVVAQYFTATPDGQWQCKQTGNVIRAGMLNFYRSFGADAFCGLTYLGLPKSNEIPIAQYQGVVKQEFERGWLVYDPQHQFDNPPGAGEVYFIRLPGS